PGQNQLLFAAIDTVTNIVQRKLLQKEKENLLLYTLPKMAMKHKQILFKIFLVMVLQWQGTIMLNLYMVLYVPALIYQSKKNGPSICQQKTLFLKYMMADLKIFLKRCIKMNLKKHLTNCS